jgi:uncharacterized protein YdeI (YjbR/CyaY-like superfamily)
MKMTNTFIASNGAGWRAWLVDHHAQEQEVWLVYFKASSGRPSIDYETSVEEALCYGWIDSIIQKIDDEKYARKFNPRRPGSFWSASNKRRMEKLIGDGRMTPIGLEKYDPQAQESSSEVGQKIKRAEIPIPAEIKQAVEANQLAWENFQRLAPSYQRQYMSWVLSAKRVETQQKRLAEVITLLEQGKKLGLK